MPHCCNDDSNEMEQEDLEYGALKELIYHHVDIQGWGQIVLPDLEAKFTADWSALDAQHLLFSLLGNEVVNPL